MIFEAPILDIFGTYDRGVPNAERIVLHANGPINLAEFGIILGLQTPTGNDAWPLRDQFLWLGSVLIQTPSWVFIYTGKGRYGVSQETHTKEPVHNIYWEKPTTILDNNGVIPILLHLNQILLGNKPNKYIENLQPQKQITEQPDAILKWLKEHT